MSCFAATAPVYTKMVSSKRILVALTVAIIAGLLVEGVVSRKVKLCRRNRQTGTCQDVTRRKGVQTGEGLCSVAGGTCRPFGHRCLCDTNDGILFWIM